MSVTLPINLNTNLVSQREANLHLVTLDTHEQDPSNNGLILVSGNRVADGLGYTPFASAGATIRAIEGYDPATLTSALFSNLHLVKGEVLTIKFEYDFKDDANNDFSFGLIAKAGGAANGFLLADGNAYNQYGGGHIYTETIAINESGDYNLLLGSADAGDGQQHSNLTIHSISYAIPDTGPNTYTVTPNGLRLLDGSQILANGAGVLPNGVPISNLLAAGGQNSGAYIVSHDAGGIVSHDAGGIVSHDAGGIVSHDAGGLISQDGGGIVSHDAGGLVASGAGNLISQDGGGIVSHDAGGLVASGGGNLVASGAGNLISQDGGGLVASGAGNIQLRTLTYKDPSALTSLDASRPLTTTPSITLQTATVIGQDRLVGETAPAGSVHGDPRIAALSTGGFAVVWADTLSGHFEVRAQLRNADGTTVAPSFVVSTETGSDQGNPSVTALSGGRFVVSWQGHSFDGSGNKSAPDIHTQIIDSHGAKIGAEQRIGSAALEETGARVVSTANGGYAVLLQAATPGIDGNTGIGQFYDSNGTLITSFGFGSTAAGTLKLAAAGVGLADGSVAIAYGEHNTALPDQDGIYLDIVSSTGTVTHSEVHVNATTLGVQGMPAIAQLANGNVVVAWIDGGPGNGADISTLRAQILDPTGARVGGEIRIADTLRGGDAPAITALADGRFDVTWDGPVTNSGAVVGLNLRSQIFSADGTTASPVFDVTTPSIDNAYRVGAPASAQLADGTLAVVGQVTAGATSTIHADLFSVGAPAPPVTLPAPVAFTPAAVGGEFSVAPDQSSFGANAAVTFANGNMGYAYVGTNGVTLQVLDSTGASISSHSVAVPGGSSSLHAAKLADERVVVTFQDGSGDIDGIIFNQDSTVSVPAFVIEHTAGKTFLPEAVAALADGRFVVTELSFVPGQANSQQYGLLHVLNPDGTTSVPTFTLQQPGTPGRYAEVTQLPDGRILVTDQAISPQDTAGSARNVYADFYSASFASLGSTLLTSNGYDLGNSNGQAAILDNGDFVSLFQTGRPPQSGNVRDYDGLHGRVFHSDGTPSSAEFIVPGFSMFGQHSPIVTAIPTGGFVVSFEGTVTNDFNSGASLDIQRYNDDGTPNGNLIVIPDGPTLPSAAILANGNLVEFYLNQSSHEVGQIFALSASSGSNGTQALTAAAPGTTPPTVPAGANAVSYTDAFGHTVTDTTDSGGRLVREVVTDATTHAVLSTQVLTYAVDGTYTTHTDLVTTTGTLSVDAVYGPRGELSETLRDPQGNVTSSATVTYNADGSVARHTVTAGQPGFDDFVYAGGLGAPNGGFVSHTHTDAAGHVTTFDVNGNVIATPPVVTPTGDTTPPPLSGVAQTLVADTGSSAHDSITANGAVIVTGTTEDVAGTRVNVFDGAVDLGKASLAGGAFSFATTLAEGVHTLHAVATDLAGNATAFLDLPTITVDRTAPTLSLSGVSGATNLVGGHVLSGTIDVADSGAPVTIRDGGTVLGVVESDAQGTFSFTLPTDVAGHSYALTATATDAAGNVGITPGSVFDFTLDFTPNQPAFGAVTHNAGSPGGIAYALYDGLLGRAPEALGLEGWADALAHGASAHDIAQGFLGSDEFSAGYGGAYTTGSDDAFLQYLYHEALGRAPDATGQAGWATFLADGGSRVDAALAFATSAENLGQIAPAFQTGVFVPDPVASDVARLYYGLLGRAPDSAGLQRWEASAHDGHSEASIAQSFLDSAEYAGLHRTAQTDMQYVDDLYLNALGRPAEPMGESGWVDALTAHTLDRAAVALGIANSVEAHLHLTAQIEAGWHLS